ncbi:glycoside hydrolase family 9 protein [Bosea sp. 124]|uniref:glycoside hydrolase family 9 protein n=1 Tax=Bosea sp. 124 TaxID=2135642 RepID=UPI000D383D2F|nr:glycoside hydrolase family 9 protein [Bosea sp. 124]PTM41472.1 endoglucanase [Bosea sp. 124]
MMFRVAFMLILGACILSSAARSASLPEVHEITIATPDTISIEIRDPPFKPGAIVPLSSPAGSRGAWINQAGEWGLVVGRQRTHLRRADIAPETYLDRAVIDRAGDYGSIGQRKVVSVYRKSVPYDSGMWRGSSGETALGASFKHYVYLKLDGPLAQGDHVIRWPGQQLPETRFSYNERQTRASAIRVNQNGYAPIDEGKIAYLSLWLPGAPDEGAVDYRRYGVKDFEILDADGSVAFSGNVTLGRSPRDPEEGTGLPAGLIDYPSVGRPGLRPASVSRQNPVTFRAPSHGLKDNQLVALAGFTGALAKLNGTATIANVTANEFSLVDVEGRALAEVSGQIGTVAPINRANRSGTFVFRIDFSRWRPDREGNYRVHIPGLGVSDAFRVAEDVWSLAARTGVAGLYNHRSGIAIDGRFGYRRPIAFKPGPDFPIYQSKLPFVFSIESGFGSVPFSAGTSASWLEGPAEAANLWGGYMDAGDWDRRIQHIEVSYALMDMFEHAGARARSMPLGIPKSSEVLSSTTYAGSDDLPDLLHEVIWNMDFYRRMQLPDGRVRGGIDSAEHPVLGEPSYLESQLVFVYAPDHVSGFRYAAAAAKLARILSGLGKADLAKLYADSAASAWRAAEIGYEAPDKFYADALEAARKTNTGDVINWAAKKADIQAVAKTYRVAAAASLYRLTDDQALRQIFESAWAEGLDVVSQGDGAWEYVNLPAGKANGQVQQSIKQAFARSVDYILAPHSTATYMSLKNAYTPAGWGQGLAPDYNAFQLLVRAHVVTGNRLILQAMQFGSAHILGANQVGLSFTTGLGTRNVRHPLHEDHRAMGVDAPRGITLYGWAPQSMTSFDWLFGEEWAPLSDTAQRGGVPYKRVAPDRLALPFYEYLIEYPGVVVQQEYTIHQSIGPSAALWIYLYGIERPKMQ